MKPSEPTAPASAPLPGEPHAPAPNFYRYWDGTYAGFWKRVLALLIDMLVMAPVGFAVGLIWEGGNLVGVIVGWTYYSVMESSPKQGTLGKMALGIKVTDLDGNRISFGRATGRYFAKWLSALILGIGYIMVAFTAKKQGLHDQVASCLVVNKQAQEASAPHPPHQGAGTRVRCTR